MDIGEVLRRRRKQRKESQMEVALKARSDAGNLSRIERGLQDAKTEHLARLCAALEMTRTELFEEIEGKSSGGHLRDPTLAFDKDTRELISVSEKASVRTRKKLVKIAKVICDDEPAKD